MNVCIYNWLILIFTALSGLGACAAMVAAIVIYKRQKKIALFERRIKVLNDFEKFIFEILPSWEWDGDIQLVSKYSKQEIQALFNDEYVVLQKNILDTANENSILIGDIRYATEKGSCHGKADYEIEEEKINKEKELGVYYREMRGKAFSKWLTI